MRQHLKYKLGYFKYSFLIKLIYYIRRECFKMFYPGYPVYPSYGNNDGYGTSWIWIIVIVFIIFFLFWGVGSNNNGNCHGNGRFN